MWPAIISAGAQIGAGLLSSQANQDANAANLAWAREAATHAIRWRVADAQKAGIHPLYALGAPAISMGAQQVGDTGLATGLANAGQSLARELSAQSTQAGRVSDIGAQVQQLQLQNMELQNGILASRLRLMNQPGNPPPMPSPEGNIMPGQGNTSQVISVKPGQTETSSPSNPAQSAVVVPDTGFAEVQGGGMAPIPSRSVKEQIEDITLPQLAWGLRNNVMPSIGASYNPPQRDPGEGKVWYFNPAYQAWYPVDRDSWQARVFVPPYARGGRNFYQ